MFIYIYIFITPDGIPNFLINGIRQVNRFKPHRKKIIFLGTTISRIV